MEILRKAVLAAILAALLAGALRAESPSVQDGATEADLKAAILLHFARYTEWPDAVFAGNPTEFRVGVLGPPAALPPIENAMKDKKIGGRTPKIIQGTTPADLKTCAMIYILESEKDQTQALLDEFKGKPILTVGETEGFGQTGGILGFYTEDKHVKFGINPDALSRSGLKASTLFRYAKKIWRDK